MRRALYFLGILDDRDLEWMIRSGRKVTVPAGTQLIEQGKPTEWLYFVLDGALVVHTPTAPQIAILKAGDVVGEISFVDARPPVASVRADVESKVGAIPRAGPRGETAGRCRIRGALLPGPGNLPGRSAANDHEPPGDAAPTAR